MAQEEPEKLVVSLRNGSTFDPNGHQLREIAKKMNGLQPYVEVVTDIERTPDLVVLLLDGDGTRPYQRPEWLAESDPGARTTSSIDLMFHEKHSAAVPHFEYICYFVSIIVLEYLSRKWNGQDLQIYKSYEYDKVKELVWRGSVTKSAGAVVVQFHTTHEATNRQPVLDAIVTLMRAGFQRSVELTQWARQVAGHLNSLELPSALDSYTNVQSHFHNVGPAMAGPLTEEFKRDDPQAISHLADQIRSHSTPRGIELLEELAAARNLDSEIKDYTKKVLDEIIADRPSADPPEQESPEGNGTAELPPPAPLFRALLETDEEPQLPDTVVKAARKFADQVHRTYPPYEDFTGETQDRHKSEDRVQTELLDALLNEASNSAEPFASAFVSLLVALKPTEIAMERLLASLASRADIQDLEKVKIREEILSQTAPEQDESEDKHAIMPDAPIETVPEHETARTGSFAAHSDNVTDEDVLGYRDYAKALAHVITDSKTQPPLTIGICAPWGRGKTTLMKLIETEIELINRQVMSSWTPLDLDFRRTIPITFDSWRYSKAEHVWAGFIDTVLRKLQQGFTGRWRKLRLAVKLNKKRDLPLIHQISVFAVAAITSLVGTIYYLGDYKTVGVAAWAVALMAFYRKFLAGAWKLASSPITERIVQLTRLPDYRTRLDPIHQIREDIKLVAREYSKNPIKGSVRRFVVFVDDIDRCGPEQIMDTLEAIKHFLDMDQFVFVIAMDARVVRHAIGKHYQFMGEGSHQKEEMGRFYLEKMIQIPFSLPPVGGERLKDLNNVLLQDYLEHVGSLPIGPSPVPPPSKEAPNVSLPSEESDVPDELLVDAHNESAIEVESKAHAEPRDTPEDAQEETSDEFLGKRVRITKNEKRAILGILETPGLEMSPRLFKRFINVYLIARYLHFERLRRIGEDKTLPPVDLAKWLALSVIFPFEAKALLQWWEENNWDDPFTTENAPFHPNGDFRLVEPDKDMSAPRKRPHTSSMFGGLDWPQLNEFGRMLRSLQVDHEIVKTTKHITDCFNLVLD